MMGKRKRSISIIWLKINYFRHSISFVWLKKKDGSGSYIQHMHFNKISENLLI